MYESGWWGAAGHVPRATPCRRWAGEGALEDVRRECLVVGQSRTLDSVIRKFLDFLLFFPRKLRERVLIKNSCSIDHQNDKTIADHHATPDHSKWSAEKICWEDAEKICWENLLRRFAEKICCGDLLNIDHQNDKTIADHQPLTTAWEDLLRRSAEKICWENLLRKSAEKICWENLLRSSAEDLLRMVVDQNFLKISFFFLRRVGLVDQDGRPPSRHFVLIGRPKLRWNANFLRRGRNPLVVSCSSDVQKWGEMRIFYVVVATLSSFPAHRTSKTEVKCESAWVVMATLSSFRAHRTSKTVVKRKFWSGPRNPLVTSCWSDVRNCCKMLIFLCRGSSRTSCAGFIHFGARRCSKTYILKFWMARRCSDTRILLFLDEPSRRIRWVDGTKLWRNANFLWKLWEASRETFVLEALFFQNLRKSRAKRSFCRLVLWNLEEVSCETFVLEVCSVKIWRSFARNVRFESLFFENLRKPRTKRSFWKLCFMKIWGSLARNVRFVNLFCEIWRKPRAKRAFWKLVLWKFEEASHETLLLEASSLKFRGSLARNVRFGSRLCEIWRKPRTKRSFWKLVLWNCEEVSRETFVLEARSEKFRGSLAWNARFGSLVWEISRKPRTKRLFWKLCSLKGFGGKSPMS